MQKLRTEKAGAVAILWMNNPPVNALGTDLRRALRAALDAVQADPAISAIVLAAEGRMFSAGADIREFDQAPQEPMLRDVIDALEGSAKPAVAAIGGPALGGGCELALGCAARVVTSSAHFGLPEVNLGLLPGAGGTQRLPRIVAPPEALRMIARGDPIDAATAVASGLADQTCDAAGLIDAACRLALHLADTGAGVPMSQRQPDPATRAAFETAAAQILRAHPGEPPVAAIVDAVRHVYDLPFAEGMQRERAHFVRLMQDDRSKALRHAFISQRAVGKLPALTGSARPAPALVGVIGGGTMGSGIAMAFASSGTPVVIIETDDAAAARALDWIGTSYARSAQRGSISEDTRAANVARVTAGTDYALLAGAELVIEAAFEDIAVKREIFTRLAAACKPGAVLASNTSYLDIDQIAAATGTPERVLGMHFFSPANVMKLVEVVVGGQTAPDVLDLVVRTARALGKTPVVVGNCHGFVGNRMLARRSEQVDRLLLEGALPQQVDDALMAFGARLGPCAMGDLAGLDISWRMRRAMGRRAPVADALVEAGRLGQKTLKGYYRYGDDARVPQHDPEVEALIRAVSKREGVTRRSFAETELIDRMILPMVNEGARALADSIAARAGDIDVIWLLGYGFPRWRGGPMFYAQNRGLAEVVGRLSALAAETGDASLEPAPLLVDLAARGGSLFDLPEKTYAPGHTPPPPKGSHT